MVDIGSLLIFVIMKSILVTGGTGYIGSHTVIELHNAGYRPIVIDNLSNSHKGVVQGIESVTEKKLNWYEGDCRSERFLNDVFQKHKDIQGVIHFAACKAVGESVNNPMKYYDNNIVSLLQVLNVMKAHDVYDMVFSSSCTVYGQPDELPVTENSRWKKANSPYGHTKQICEQILKDLTASNLSFTSAILRYFNPIGAHPSATIGELPNGVPDNLIPFLTQVAAGIRESLTVFGSDYSTIDGTCVRDYIHVVDLAKAHVKALEWTNSHPGEIDAFNIGTGNGNSVKEVVETFQKVNGIELHVLYGDRRPGDIAQIYANCDKATDKLHWTAEHSLEDALKHAWKWQKKLGK